MRISRNGWLVVALVLVDVSLFMISGIPRYKNAHHGADNVIGNIIWAGFLLGFLTLLVIGATTGIRATRRRRATAVR